MMRIRVLPTRYMIQWNMTSIWWFITKLQKVGNARSNYKNVIGHYLSNELQKSNTTKFQYKIQTKHKPVLGGIGILQVFPYPCLFRLETKF